MTNKEIEKRFLFDLYMKRFAMEEERVNVSLFRSLYKESIRFQLIELLKNLNFKSVLTIDNCKKDLTYHGPVIVYVYPNEKAFITFTKPIIECITMTDNIPEYIEEYQLEEGELE